MDAMRVCKVLILAVPLAVPHPARDREPVKNMMEHLLATVLHTGMFFFVLLG